MTFWVYGSKAGSDVGAAVSMAKDFGRECCRILNEGDRDGSVCC